MTAADLLICGHFNNHSSTREEKLGYTAWTLLEEAMDRYTLQPEAKFHNRRNAYSRARSEQNTKAFLCRSTGSQRPGDH